MQHAEFPNRRGQAQIDVAALQRLLGGGTIWVVAALICLLILAVKAVRIEEVSGEQVGFLLSKINGDIEVITQSGKQIFNGLTREFYVLDRTLQTMEMTEEVNRGDRQGKDDLKVKTIDGSDVYVDLKIQYRIDVTDAAVVLHTSGVGDSFKKKWARDYIRSVCRDRLGELTTEQFYDAAMRDAKVITAANEVNERLKPFGIIIDSIVIPRRPHFYKEYEEMIKRKKEADQAVHAERSRALAAKQRQQTLIVQQTNAKNVAVEQFEGTMSQLVIAAQAEGERARKESDAYYEQQTVAADAGLYRMTKQAEAILARKAAEAEGIMALKKAVEGEGGRNMVMLEYARKLKEIRISGKPVAIQGAIERFEHLKGAAAEGR